MDCEDECDRSSEENTPASNNRCVTFSPLVIILNSDHGDGCGPYSEINLRGSECSSDSSDSVSSSSSNFSLDNFIQINDQIFIKCRGENNIPQPNGGTKPSNEKEKCSVTSEAFHMSDESINKCLESTSQMTDVKHESSVECTLPTLSPSIQVMECPEGFDPKRISASYSQRPSTPMEGSADGSLFSASRTDVNLCKSEKSVELLKIVESCQSGEPCKSRGFCQSGVKGTVDISIDDVSKAPVNNQVDAKVGDFRGSSSAKCESNKTSIQPFASPIKKKSSHRLCPSPDCCLEFHCCKWPIHCTKWPGFLFKWFIRPSCSRNCLSWLGYCCNWPSCHCKCLIWSSCCVKRQC